MEVGEEVEGGSQTLIVDNCDCLVFRRLGLGGGHTPTPTTRTPTRPSGTTSGNRGFAKVQILTFQALTTHQPFLSGSFGCPRWDLNPRGVGQLFVGELIVLVESTESSTHWYGSYLLSNRIAITCSGENFLSEITDKTR